MKMLKDLKIKILIMFVIALGTVTCVSAAEPAKAFTIARVWYQGGGDWYNDPSVIPNLLKYIAGATGMRVATT
ncbi:MAG TPA: hypothetical protein ENH09_00065, partial [Bacteroidetes bacterium]|nr:hypothetical protein [Bacteroidota bacterium]